MGRHEGQENECAAQARTRADLASRALARLAAAAPLGLADVELVKHVRVRVHWVPVAPSKGRGA